MTASVLAVCTGNVCRSPAVERLLLARLGTDARGVAVSSAGTHALVGEPVDPPMADLITGSGGVPAPFAARQLERAYIGQADLVLVMTRAHRSAVVALEPAAVRRTFLLPELAAIASAVAADGWPSDVAEQAAARLAALPRLAAPYRARLGDRTDLEVPDPYRQPAGPYVEAFERIRGAVDCLATAIAGAGGT